MSGLDLAALDIEKGAETGARLELMHPTTNAPTGAWITLLGADSEAYRERQRALQRKRFDRMAKQRRMAISPEELEAEGLDLLVASTTGWGGLEQAGVPIPFSPGAARELYAKRRWIREQVEEFIGDRANFLPRSAAAS